MYGPAGLSGVMGVGTQASLTSGPTCAGYTAVSRGSAHYQDPAVGRTRRAPPFMEAGAARPAHRPDFRARAYERSLLSSIIFIAGRAAQGFFFNTKPGLQFGLVQLEGGPCGVLAAVQAHVLANLRTTVSQGVVPVPSCAAYKVCVPPRTCCRQDHSTCSPVQVSSRQPWHLQYLTCCGRHA